MGAGGQQAICLHKCAASRRNKQSACADAWQKQRSSALGAYCCRRREAASRRPICRPAEKQSTGSSQLQTQAVATLCRSCGRKENETSGVSQQLLAQTNTEAALTPQQ